MRGDHAVATLRAVAGMLNVLALVIVLGAGAVLTVLLLLKLWMR